MTSAPRGATQLDLLPAAGDRERRLETAIDALVGRFGSGVVQRAGDLRRDRGVGVAANLDFLARQRRLVGVAPRHVRCLLLELAPSVDASSTSRSALCSAAKVCCTSC